jgi:hypothetical protein
MCLRRALPDGQVDGLPAGKIPKALAAANHFQHGIGVAEGARWRNQNGDGPWW